jgi:hypothetical protein
MKLGTYTMQLALDTHSPLGLLVTKRPVVLAIPVDSPYEILVGKYSTYARQGNAAGAAEVRRKLRKLLARQFPPNIKRGEVRPVGASLSRRTSSPRSSA